VQGAGGLTTTDASTLDGLDSTQFLRSDANDTLSAIITGHASNTEVLRVRSSSYSSDYLYIGGWSSANSNDIGRIRMSTNLHIDSPANGDLYLNWYASNKSIRLGNAGQTVLAAGSNTVWHAGNDGSGSGLDADTVDGIQGGSFLRSDANDTFTGTVLTINAGSSSNYFEVKNGSDTDNWIRFYCESNTGQIGDTFAGATDKQYIYFSNPNGSNDPGYIMHETRASESNEGILHLVPTDDNAYGDYVSIHGTNDADCLKLHTDGTIETASGYQLKLKSGNGNVYVNDNLDVNGNVNSSSDIKLKTNIKTLTNSLNKVLQMRGVEYDRIDMDNKHQIGVIAQEVEEIIPELVSESDGIKNVSYGNITALLIEAIKEQQDQINTLKQEIENLKK
jgi:putative lipoic acid-binding regulatory protein